MASLRASHSELPITRNPLSEDYLDMDTLLTWGPVRPVDGPFKGTSVVVGDEVQMLKFQAGVAPKGGI